MYYVETFYQKNISSRNLTSVTLRSTQGCNEYPVLEWGVEEYKLSKCGMEGLLNLDLLCKPTFYIPLL